MPADAEERLWNSYCLGCGTNNLTKRMLHGWTTELCPTCDNNTLQHEDRELVLSRAKGRMRRAAVTITALTGHKPSVAERLAYWEPEGTGVIDA